MTVGIHMKQMQQHEDKFIKKYGLTRNNQQQVGSAWDAETSDGERIEFKADISAAKTGNTFVECRYSRDGGATWRDSGIALAIEQSKWWVIQVGDSTDYRWFLTADLQALIKLGNFVIKGIRKNINGNSEQIRCEGYIIPLETLKAYEKPAPVQKIFLDTKPNPFV